MSLTTTSIIIPQNDSPIQILSYRAKYQEGGDYVPEGIRHDLDFKSNSNSPIMAVQFGLVAFDIWNEFLNNMGGVSIKFYAPGSKDSGTWIASSIANFSFFTGVAYIQRVRFSDGLIWSADIDAITKELSKIEQDFNVSNLKKKDS
jgi:hypothetical protein